MVHVIVWLQPTIDSYLYSHALASLYISFTCSSCYMLHYSLAVDSHTVHFQTTTRNKRTYEPACCVVSNTYVTKLVFCPTITSSLATPLDVVY